MGYFFAWIVVIVTAYLAVDAVSSIDKYGIFAIFIGLFWAGICGVIFAILFSGRMGSIFGGAIFHPTRYLKKRPDIFSPIQGLMAAGHWREAEEALQNIFERDPVSPPANLLWAEIAIAQDRHDELLDRLESYFYAAEPLPSEERMQLLLHYCDYAIPAGRRTAAVSRLSEELKRVNWPSAERQLLTDRLQAIARQK